MLFLVLEKLILSNYKEKLTYIIMHLIHDLPLSLMRYLDDGIFFTLVGILLFIVNKFYNFRNRTVQ